MEGGDSKSEGGNHTKHTQEGMQVALRSREGLG